MTVFHEQHPVQGDRNVTFHDVTEAVRRAVSRSGVRNGIAVVYSQHTTCSVMLQEESHDATYHGSKYLLQDLVNVLEKLIPRCRHEGQYLHPGRDHIDHAVKNLGEEASWSLNTDAHLRSCLIGRSESIPIVDGKLELGQFGQVYFVDFDTVRARERTVRIQIVGE
jgi:secondary thiamine-phosphate synthase enzyme